MKLFKSKKGFAFDVKGIIATLVAGSILMMVGLFTYSKVSGSIDQSAFTATENTTMSNVRSNVLSGFDLSAIIFIVLAAGGIIGVLLLAFR